MIKPDPPELKALAMFVRTHPDFVVWMDAEYRRELEKLPSATQNTAVMQGRCQVWGELTKLFHESPEIAAKL